LRRAAATPCMAEAGERAATATVAPSTSPLEREPIRKTSGNGSTLMAPNTGLRARCPAMIPRMSSNAESRAAWHRHSARSAVGLPTPASDRDTKLGSRSPTRSNRRPRMAYRLNPVPVDARIPLIPAQSGIQGLLAPGSYRGPRFGGDERMLHGKRARPPARASLAFAAMYASHVLPAARDYGALYRSFRWQIPARYNIGVDVCDRWAEIDPARTAISNLGDGAVEEVSSGALREASNRLANALAARGIGRGDRIALLLPQGPAVAVSHIAIYKLGAIALPLAMLFGVEAIAYRLEDSGARALITNAQGLAELAAGRDVASALAFACAIDGPVDGAEDLHAVLARAASDFTPLATTPDDPALMVYTSGTTGPPKGALHAHRVLLGHLPGIEVPHEFLPQ